MSSADKNMVFICVDASQHSSQAFQWYVENIHKKGDVVGLVHIHVPPNVPPTLFYTGGIAASDLYTQEIHRSIAESKRVMKTYHERCDKANIESKQFVQTVEDSVGHSICVIAKTNHAKLIVIGQRGLGSVRRTLFGSVSDYVLHHAHIPVIVVPPVEKKTE